MSKSYPSAPAMDLDEQGNYTATLETSAGTIEVELFAARSPKTVNNFVFLARDGFYDGVIFHRVINGFMIQGGDPEGSGRGGPGYRFDDELSMAREMRYPRGTLAMANAGPNTNGSQFFIVHRDAQLQPQYSVFGRVTSGLEVVDAIAETATGRDDRPVEDVVVQKVTINQS